MALQKKLPLVSICPGRPSTLRGIERRVQFMSTKNTILKKYDGRFKDIFQEIYDRYAGSAHSGCDQISTFPQ